MAVPPAAAEKEARPSGKITPQDLVNAFKSNGSFDALRTELLRSFTASPSGDQFNERTREIIMEKLHAMYDPSADNASNHSQSIGGRGTGSTHASPGRTTSVPKNRHDAAEHILKELERHSVYQRAEQDMSKSLLAEKTNQLDKDLTKTLENLRAQRAAEDKDKQGKFIPTSGAAENGTKSEGSKPDDMRAGMQVD